MIILGHRGDCGHVEFAIGQDGELTCIRCIHGNRSGDPSASQLSRRIAEADAIVRALSELDLRVATTHRADDLIERARQYVGKKAGR